MKKQLKKLKASSGHIVKSDIAGKPFFGGVTITINPDFPLERIFHLIFNVIDLTDRFIANIEASFLNAVFSGELSVGPDRLSGRGEQVEQFM